MSPAYGKGVREHLGNATLVYDQCHVVSTVVAGPGEGAAGPDAARRHGAGGPGRDPLVVAQESRALDGARGPALGATTRDLLCNS